MKFGKVNLVPRVNNKYLLRAKNLSKAIRNFTVLSREDTELNVCLFGRILIRYLRILEELHPRN